MIKYSKEERSSPMSADELQAEYKKGRVLVGCLAHDTDGDPKTYIYYFLTSGSPVAVRGVSGGR